MRITLHEAAIFGGWVGFLLAMPFWLYLPPPRRRPRPPKPPRPEGYPE